MNTLLALAFSAVLSVNPTEGKVPYTPEIKIDVKGDFAGMVCLDVDQAASGDHVFQYCELAKTVDGKLQIVWTDITANAAGSFKLRLLLVSGTEEKHDEPVEFNSVVVTVE